MSGKTALLFFIFFFSFSLFAFPAKSLLEITATEGWVLYESPLPNVEVVLVKKTEIKKGDFRDNITLIKDKTATIYTDIDTYVDDAVKKMKLIKNKLISKTKKKSPKVGPYYVIETVQENGENLVQVVFFREGYGFYILTGSFSSADKQANRKDFTKMAEGAFFR